MNNPNKRRRGASAALAGLAFVLAACGGGSQTSWDDESTTASGSESAAADTTPTPSTDPTSVATDAAASTTVPATKVELPTIVALPTPALIPFEDESSEPVIPLGSIAIPAIGIDRPMFEGIRLPTFDLGPGHWPGTAMPGQIGNVVVGGHRTESHADFGDLDLLQPGNEVIFTDTTGARFTYLVESTEIIDPFAAAIVNQTRKHTATLFACHPKGTTDQRIVVRLTLGA